MNNLPTGTPSITSKFIWAPTPASKPFANDTTLVGNLPDVTLNLTGLTKGNVFNGIWGPGSNGIALSPQHTSDKIDNNAYGLNYSTQPGVGSSKIINGIYTTGFSLQSKGGWYNNQWNWVSDPETGSWKPEDEDPSFNFLTYPGLDNQITVTLPTGAKAIVLNLEELSLAGTNGSTQSNQIVFEPKPGVRYGGFAWYGDNRQSNLEIKAQSSIPIPAGGSFTMGALRLDHT
ncbi:hypothetical protein AAF134_07295 [Synechococcus lacustris Tous-12m]